MGSDFATEDFRVLPAGRAELTVEQTGKMPGGSRFWGPHA